MLESWSVVAGVAQLVEQLIRNEKVASSIPAIGTTHTKHKASSTRRGLVVSGVQLGRPWPGGVGSVPVQSVNSTPPQ